MMITIFLMLVCGLIGGLIGDHWFDHAVVGGAIVGAFVGVVIRLMFVKGGRSGGGFDFPDLDFGD